MRQVKELSELRPERAVVYAEQAGACLREINKQADKLTKDN